MCRNHSHLIATYVGESTAGDVPVLMFVLADPWLKIEAPGSDGGVLKIRTSGMLYVPASMLAGLSAFHPQVMAGQCMSVFFTLDDVPTITAMIAKDLSNYYSTSAPRSSEQADSLNQPDEPDPAKQDLER